MSGESEGVILIDLIRRVAILETGHALTAEATKKEITEVKEEMRSMNSDVSEIKGLIMQIKGGRKVLFWLWWILGGSTVSFIALVAYMKGFFVSIPPIPH